MKTKEKAKELVEKYIEYTQEWSEIDGYVINMYNAKQCALIAVDEILNIKGNLNFDYVWYEQRETDINNWFDTESIIPIRMHALEYWQEVKQEINKL